MALKDYFSRDRGERPEYGFIDLHGHLIPEVDDGPRSFSESLRLLRNAHHQGTRHALATPHAFTEKWGMADPREVVDAFENFRQRLEDTRGRFRHGFLDSLRVGPGAENKVCDAFLQALEKGRVMTLTGSRYLLTEFHSVREEQWVLECVDRIQAAGLIPLLAHPERLVSRFRCSEFFSRMAEEGCFFLINAPSLDGSFGLKARWNGLEVLRELPDRCMLASDGHRPRTRPLTMLDVWRSLSLEFPSDQLKTWTHDAPSRVLGNQDLNSGKNLEPLPDTFLQTPPFP